MFFSISAHQHDNFSSHWKIGNLCIDTDSGWSVQQRGSQTLIYKGYTDQGRLDQQLDYVGLGNFCVIAVDAENKTVAIRSDRYRSFPIYYENQQQITNLQELKNTAWTDSVLTCDFDLNIVENKIDVIGPIDSSELDYQTALDTVDNMLLTKTKNFVANNDLPLKVYLSGGADSMLVYSYLVKAGATVELIDYFHLEHDYFWRANSNLIRKNWAYSQIHHWREPCVLSSGAPGDEFLLRSPTTANLFLKRNGLSIPALLEQHRDSYHYDYFSMEKHQKIFREQEHTTQDTSDWSLCNIVANDWQHWHLGNTLTWTPLRDLEIFKIILRLPLDRAIGQILNSDFSKTLIERNFPGGTKYLSDKKNTGAILKNLNKLFV